MVSCLISAVFQLKKQFSSVKSPIAPLLPGSSFTSWPGKFSVI
jgi:hypothetical protein